MKHWLKYTGVLKPQQSLTSAMVLSADCFIQQDGRLFEPVVENEIVGVSDALGWEMLLDLARDVPLLHQTLDSTCLSPSRTGAT